MISRIISLKLILIIILVILIIENSFSQSYDIGYRILKLTDISRTSNSINKELGHKDSLYSYRKITTSIWYPSTICETDKKIYFGDFLESIELEDKKDFNKKDSAFQSADKFADYYDLGSSKRLYLERLLTNSYNNSKLHSGKFPLVVYIPGLNGFSIENHTLCETITKHGYIVVSFNSKGTESRWAEPVTKDYETLIRDILFIIGELSKNESVDRDNIILIGHSIGGYANILTKIRDIRINGLVSLDGSIKHDFNRSKEFIYNDFKKVNCPFLSISDQDIINAKNYLDSMPYSDRYYYQLSGFEHDSYKSISYLIKDDFDSLKYNKYLNINSLIAVFVDNLSGNLNEKLNDYNNKYLKGEWVNYYNIKSIPDIDKFKLMVGDAGFSDITILYQKLRNDNQYFKLTEQELVNWGNRLKYLGYKREATEIYKLIIDLNPRNESIKNKLEKMKQN